MPYKIYSPNKGSFANKHKNFIGSKTLAINYSKKLFRRKCNLLES